jgi:LuxR family maltose regulon positive regulatory protein
LPNELVRSRPRLSIGFAWELLFLGDLEAAEVRMRDADHLLEPTAHINPSSEASSSGTVVVNEEKSRSLRASLAIAWAFHAQALGDVAGTVKHARRALTLVPETDHYTHGLASAQLGLACWTNGDLASAFKYLADAMASLRMAGDLLFATTCAYVLGGIKIAEGRLFEAANIYEEALQLAARRGEPVLPGAADLYVGLSKLYREQSNVEAARQHLLRGEELGKQAAFSPWPYDLYLAQARIKEDQGDLAGALELLEAAERLYHRTPVPNLHPVAALKARVWVRQGRLVEALGWAQRQGLSTDDDLSYLREFEHITLARALIARYMSDQAQRSIHEAVGLMERLLKAAEEGGRMGSAIEILVPLALAHQAQDNLSLALASLERALTLAEPQGYARIFVDEGQPMLALLREATKHGIVPSYVSRLLTAFGKAEGKRPVSLLLIEPLSARELEVLRLLGTELNGPEIARELMVSLNTIRTHTKHIYNKLGVNNRRAAVRRAQKLDLL